MQIPSLEEAGECAAIWQCAGYTVLLCFSLFKTGAVSKAILNAH